MELVAFVAGVVVLVAMMRRVERIGAEQDRRLSAREFKREIGSGGRLSAGAHVLYFSAFAMGAWGAVFVFRRLPSHATAWFILPITVFLAGEMAVAVFELVFGVTPCIGRTTSFLVGPGTRKRGAARAAVSTCCVGAALIAAALS